MGASNSVDAIGIRVINNSRKHIHNRRDASLPNQTELKKISSTGKGRDNSDLTSSTESTSSSPRTSKGARVQQILYNSGSTGYLSQLSSSTGIMSLPDDADFVQDRDCDVNCSAPVRSKSSWIFSKYLPSHSKEICIHDSKGSSIRGKKRGESMQNSKEWAPDTNAKSSPFANSVHLVSTIIWWLSTPIRKFEIFLAVYE